MTTKEVFVICVPFLDLKLYYVSNNEWSFEITEARFFSSTADAQMVVNRLKTVDSRSLLLHSINPEELTIKSSVQEVTEVLHFSMQ